MKKSKIILSVILFISILNSAACLSGDKYYTYQLEATNKQHYFQSHYDYTIEVSRTQFEFSINHNISIHNGTAYNAELHGSDKYIYTGPYDLYMSFDVKDDTRYDSTNVKKIVVNKMMFQSKDNLIDLREKVTVKVGNNRSDKKELLNLKNTGIIDLAKHSYGYGEKYYHITFIYEDIDAAFNHNENFTIYYDIDLEYKSGTSNYAFAATFNRATITERLTIGERIMGIIVFGSYVCVYSCASCLH